MAVILAGGKGTRLRPFTMTIPKPLLPLGEVPILEVVLRQLQARGFRRIVVTLGHMPHLFAASIGDGTQWGLRVEYSREEQPLGTAGPIRLIDNLESDFLVMNGDLLTTLDFAALLAEHRRQGAAATIAVSRRTVAIDYGVIEVDDSGELRQYIEKPTIPYHVSMGINVLSKRAVDLIPPGVRFDMPDLMIALKKAGEKVFCFVSDAYWQDIGRFEDYQKASADFVADASRFLPAPPS